MTKHTPNPHLLDTDWLYDQYINQEKAMGRIAKEIGVTTVVVSKYIKRYEFPIRTGGQQKTLTVTNMGTKKEINGKTVRVRAPAAIDRNGNPNILADKMRLEYQYVEKGLALRDIAKMCGRSSKRAVTKALEYHGIPVRTLKDARANRSSKGPEFHKAANPLANDLQHVKERYDAGVSIKRLALELGISTDAMRHRLEHGGVQKRKSWEHRIGTKHTEVTKTKMSKTAVDQIVAGTRKSHSHGNRSWCMSPNQERIHVRSSYERDYADYLFANDIDFYYEPRIFSLSNGRSYVPDFYLPATDEYIEIKGYLEDGQSEKYELFQKEYPDIKWSMKRKEDLEGILRTTFKPKVVVLAGVSGSGKSWVCDQLVKDGKYNYLSYDQVGKKHHLDILRQPPNENPTLYDLPYKTSTFLRRHSHEFDIEFLVVAGDFLEVKKQLVERGGKVTKTIYKRWKVMKARAKKYASFVGSSTDVLRRLSFMVQ